MKPRPLKGPRKKPKGGLTPTTCPKCGSGPWRGDKLKADDAECPDCQKLGDKAETRARFAPAKSGPLVREPQEEPSES